MAEKSQVTRADRKAELISELAWSRAEMSRDLHDARNDLDLVAHLKHSVVQRKTIWLTGAAVAGWVLSRLPVRRKKSEPKALHVSVSRKSTERNGMLLAILGALFSMFRPVLTSLATRKISELAARQGGDWRNPPR